MRLLSSTGLLLDMLRAQSAPPCEPASTQAVRLERLGRDAVSRIDAKTKTKTKTKAKAKARTEPSRRETVLRNAVS